MTSFAETFDIYAIVIKSSLCDIYQYNQKDAMLITDIVLYQFTLSSFNGSTNKSLSDKEISNFITFCARIMFRIKTMAIKKNKKHKNKINEYYKNNKDNDSLIKKELLELVECQTILSDLQSMYIQIGRINDMIFGDYKDTLKDTKKEDIEMTNIKIFPYETQVYLEISFTQEILTNNFLDNLYFNDLIQDKCQYFNGLYELNNLLQLYNIFWINYKNKWNENELKEQDKLKKHYLGQCECCLALYQSFYNDDQTIKRSKMKDFAKKLNVDDVIVWSDEEIETEQEKKEFNDLSDRLKNLLG